MLNFKHSINFEGKVITVTVDLKTTEEYMPYTFPQVCLDYHTYTRDKEGQNVHFKGRVRPHLTMTSSGISILDAIELIKQDITRKARDYSDKAPRKASCYIDKDYEED